MQLKLDHEYFKSYLIRLPEYTTNRCFICGTKENSEHLILHCKATQAIREELKQEFDIKEFSLKNLFNIKSGQEFLFKFLENTQVLTRNWLLQQANLEAEVSRRDYGPGLSQGLAPPNSIKARSRVLLYLLPFFLSLVSSYSAIHTVALLLYMPGRHMKMKNSHFLYILFVDFLY